MADASEFAVLTFVFTAGGVQAWTADKDYLLVAAKNSTTGQASMFSADPFNTIASVLGGLTRLLTDILVICNNERTAVTGLHVPVIGGRTYYARADGITTLQLWLEPPSQLI